ncbi:MAG: NEW3 domain-containing protein [Anaerolineae bacterium]
MRTVRSLARVGFLVLVSLLVMSAPGVAWAQDEQPGSNLPDLLVYTDFPTQVIGIGEAVTLKLNVRSGADAQIVALEVQDVPEGWDVTLRGGGRIVKSVFVRPDDEVSVDLRVEPPADVEAGTYRLNVVARGADAESELPVELVVQERVPPSLAFDVELPIVRGKPTSNFRYNVTLKNEGDEELTVNLLAESPPFILVTFKSGTQEVTSLPLGANESKRLSVEADIIPSLVPADTYPIVIHAQGGDAQTSATLAAEVVGESSLTLTTVDERLSGEAEVGSETVLQLVVQNTGSAPARAVKMSASPPSEWSIQFEPEEIEVIEPAQQAEVMVRMKPADKAIAGDYMVTFRARPEDGSTESVEYRVTVRTSTLWGIAGVVLIAVAVGAVGLAVMRFGRR